MKKYFCLFLFLSSFAYANPNYKNGNGTILYEEEIKNHTITIRKCQLSVIAGEFLDDKMKNVYENYDYKNVIGKLLDNEEILITKFCRIKDLANKSERENGEIWLRIKSKSLSGWICTRNKDYRYGWEDPYIDNTWEVIEEIDTNGIKWTVRKYIGIVSIWENLNIRDNPGTTNTKVLSVIKPNRQQLNVNTLAMTEETETIDGKKDHWIKIEYKGIEGWIFGGYASVERGGLKYSIPDDEIKFMFGWD
jgi:hypothetical protein